MQTADLIARKKTIEELIESISYPLLHPGEYPELQKEVNTNPEDNFSITDDEIDEIINDALKNHKGGNKK